MRLTTILDDEITGYVYAYDPITSAVTLITSSPSPSSPTPAPPPSGPGPHDVRIVKVSFLKDVAVTGPAPSGLRFATAEPRIGRIHTGSVVSRESTAAMDELRRQQARIGKGVSREGQEIFDALCRTFVSPRKCFFFFLSFGGGFFFVGGMGGGGQRAVKVTVKWLMWTVCRMSCRWHDKQIVVLDSVVITEPYALADVKGNDLNAVKRVKKVVCSPPVSILLPLSPRSCHVAPFLPCRPRFLVGS